MPLDDIPQLDEIDALLDGLSSADTLEVYEKLLPYGNHMVAAAAAHRALSGGGGGGGVSTQTATVTTDPDTFVGEHVFDLGAPCVVNFRCEITAQDGDGETFGTAPGEIHGDQNVSATSQDNVTYIPGFGNATYFHDEPNGLVGDVFEKVVAAARYIKVGVVVYDSDFQIYAGLNHPTVTFTVTVTYR